MPLGKWLTNSNTGEKLQEQFSSTEEELALAFDAAERCDEEGKCINLQDFIDVFLLRSSVLVRALSIWGAPSNKQD